jgi:hypothetical protein
MESADRRPAASPAAHEIARPADHRAAAAAWGTASLSQATAAAPLWRALSEEGALWLLTSVPFENEK